MLDTSVESNSSIGIKALTIARILNGVDIANRAILYDELFQQLGCFDLPALLFNSEEAREFRQQFSQSNRSFSERFLGIPMKDLGGRRYSDSERDRIQRAISELKLNLV